MTVLCNQPEAFTLDLGDNQSCYLWLARHIDAGNVLPVLFRLTSRCGAGKTIWSFDSSFHTKWKIVIVIMNFCRCSEVTCSFVDVGTESSIWGHWWLGVVSLCRLLQQQSRRKGFCCFSAFVCMLSNVELSLLWEFLYPLKPQLLKLLHFSTEA